MGFKSTHQTKDGPVVTISKTEPYPKRTTPSAFDSRYLSRFKVERTWSGSRFTTPKKERKK